jgi:hypothetical protein
LESLHESPIVKNGEIDQTIYRETVDALQIERLDAGVLGPQIRIWYDYGKNPLNSKVLVMKRQQEVWQGTLIEYNYTRDSVGKHRMIGKTSRNVSPKSGWNAVLEDLFTYDIAKLPTMDGSKLGSYADGNIYTVEFAQPNFYRTYSYLSPCSYSNIDKADLMCSILNLVHKEFGVQ